MQSYPNLIQLGHPAIQQILERIESSRSNKFTKRGGKPTYYRARRPLLRDLRTVILAG